MVSVRNLSRRFGSKLVLDDISLEIPKGEIFAIMGSSGGGKTTLLRCISGLIQPSSGSVLVDSIDVARRPEQARRKMGMVFQSAALFDYLNVEDNVLFGVRRWHKVSSKEQRSMVKEALHAVGLEGAENLMPAELSGGMRKRVGIARALALKPEVMLYDEPTTGLDPITAYAIDSLIAEVKERYGVTSLIVSHDVSSVYRVSNRIGFLDKGKLIFTGDPGAFGESELESIKELVEKARATSFQTFNG